MFRIWLYTLVFQLQYVLRIFVMSFKKLIPHNMLFMGDEIFNSHYILLYNFF